MPPPVPQDLPAAADRLYGLDPGEFTGARNELAGAAKRSGNDDLARQIATLRRPSTAAWAVNLLLRRRRPDLQRLLALADRLRDGGTSRAREINQMAGRLVTAMVRLADELATEQGHPLSPALSDQVRGTLRAAMANRSAAAAVLSGHLVAALEPAQLAGLGDGAGDEGGDGVDAAVAVPLAVTSLTGHAQHRAEAHDDALAAARTEAAEAARQSDEAARRAEQAGQEVSVVRDERDDLTAMVQRTRQLLNDQEVRLAAARDRLTDAERTHRELARRADQARRRADEAQCRADDAARR